jgi:hypothetical protein
MQPQVNDLKQRIKYPNDLVVLTITSNNQATAFFISPLSMESSNKSKKGRRDDAGELEHHDKKLREEASLLGYHYEPLEDKLAKVHPDLLEESKGSKDDNESVGSQLVVKPEAGL